ncbi:hypothetical protein [Citrobacter amalonaticus]|uniref:hypothetical protein n=1 Tax=Citrobacter amalonaticus TaxID=35703 RepID=UPI0031F2FC86
MDYYEVAKTIYLNSDNDFYLKYEILQDEQGEINLVMAFMEVRIEIGGTSVPVWAKIEDLPLDHLDPPKNSGFQTSVRMDTRPVKSLSTVIELCKQHRMSFVAPDF